MSDLPPTAAPQPAAPQTDLQRLLGANIRKYWRLYTVAMIAMVIVAGMTAATAFIMQGIVDTMTQPEQRDKVMWVAAAVAAIFAFKGMANYVQLIAMNRAGRRIIATMQEDLYAALLQQGMLFFNTRDSSTLVLRITQGANAASTVVNLVVASYVRDVLTVVFLVGVMLYQQPFLSIFALLVGPFALLGVRYLLAKSRDMADMEQSSLGEIIKVMQETAGGVRVIKAFALEQKMRDRMGAAITSVETRANAFANISAITSPLMDTLSGLAIAAIVALSAFDFLGLERTTPGAMISFVTALLMAYEPAKRLTKMRLQIARSMIAVSRMYELMDSPQTMNDLPDARDIPGGRGAIVFEKVSFAFKGRKTVLKSVSQTFPAGKTTALVGPSGGGKSTMINMIMRMYDPSKGRVLIDGLDLRHATTASLRDKIAFVSQDTFLFSSTIMENIRLGHADATDADVIAAAKIANAHDFIMEMPHGYDTEVGENGGAISGGQKQRLAIARAVLRRAPILLLDEATSALDAISEGLVRDALETISKGVTSVVIAHRLSTILSADLICYVEGGKIIESGSLDALLAKNGPFARLYEQQFGTGPTA